MTYQALTGNWTKGSVDGCTFHIKHYEEASDFGIGKGRISKLEIRKDGEFLTNYDRGWDIEVADEARGAYDKILAKFN